MGKGRVIAGGSRLLAGLFLSAAVLSLGGKPAWGGGLVGGSYTLNWDNKIDKKDLETTDTTTLKEVLEVKYKGFLKPVVENELTLKVEHERTQDKQDKIKINPIITLGYKGSNWSAGAKRTIDDSNEPGKNPKVTDAYFMEFFIKPPRTTLPDLKAKYNLDLDSEKGVTDTAKHAFTASSIYHPMDWLEIKGDYNLNRSFDNMNPDLDTRDDKRSISVGIRQVFSDKVKFNSEYRVDVARGATFLDAGGTTNNKEDQTHTWKNTLGFRPFRDTTVDMSYDFDLKQNIVNGEHTFTENIKGAVAQKIGIFDLRGDYTRIITEPRHTADDNRKTEDTWTTDAKWKFSKQLDFTLKYQNKTTDEVHFADPSKDATSGSKIYSGSWNGELSPFWRASASFDKTDTYTNDVKTTVEKKYSLKSTFDFKNVNLTMEPTLDIANKVDLLKTPAEETETRDFKFRLAYKILSTRNAEAKVDHTYGRKTDTSANNIQRTDSTTGNLTWRDPLPGWNLGFDVTRSGTDTSGDDSPPDINSTFAFRGEYKRDKLSFSTSYKFDKKRLTDNAETYDAKVGWTAASWDLSLTYSFTKTFSTALNESYSLGLAFKYNL